MSDSRGRSDDGTGEATRPDGGPEVDAADSESAATAAAAENSTNDGVRGTIRHVFVVAVTEYRLAVRSRWALALTALFVVFGGVMLTFSGSAVGPAGAERVVASLTSLAAYLVPLAALALGYDAIVGRE
ncbi:ABC transporter permease, partial [Halorubrum ezzemoulense]